MRVLVAGATGAVGRPLVRMLREGGHEVLGTTRSEAKAGLLRELGAEPVVCDARDGKALRRAVLGAEPEAIVNQLTDLSAPLNPRKYAEWMEPTNRLRIRVHARAGRRGCRVRHAAARLAEPRVRLSLGRPGIEGRGRSPL